MTIFDYLNDILFTKRGNSLQNVDEESSFNQYMINRWSSMHSPVMATLVNNTTNWLYSVFETKQQYYRFVSKVWPRLQFKRIHYIKKTKDDTVDIEQNVEVLAKRMQLSTREIRDYLNM